MTTEQVNDLRKTLGITVSGYNAPRPVCSFAHFNFDEQLMKVIRKSGFTQPTPIQAQVFSKLNIFLKKNFILINYKQHSLFF